MRTTQAQQRLLDPGSGEALGEVAMLGDVRVSVRRCEEDALVTPHHDHVVVVLEGTGVLRFDDGEAVDLRPGVCLWTSAGDRTRWQVGVPLRLLEATPV